MGTKGVGFRAIPGSDFGQYRGRNLGNTRVGIWARGSRNLGILLIFNSYPECVRVPNARIPNASYLQTMVTNVGDAEDGISNACVLWGNWNRARALAYARRATGRTRKEFYYPLREMESVINHSADRCDRQGSATRQDFSEEERQASSSGDKGSRYLSRTDWRSSETDH